MTSIEKNRVFSTNDIETLRTTTMGTFQTGSSSAQTWDKEIQNLRSLLGSAKVKSPALTGALDGIIGNLYNPEWEGHGAWAGNALGFVAEGIPQQDAKGEQYETVIVTAYNNADNIMDMVHTVCITKEANETYSVHNVSEKVENEYVCKQGFPTLYEAIKNISDEEPRSIFVIGISKSK